MLAAEEERFGETLERGMEMFEEAAAKGEITGDDVFDLQTTYGFPTELTEELARERGLAFNDEEYTRLWRSIERSRAGERRRRAHEPSSPARRARSSSATSSVDVRTAITAYADLGDGYFQVKLAESPFYPAGGGQVTDAGWIEKDDGTRAELVEALRLDDDQELVFRGEGFADGDRVRAVVAWNVRYPDDGEPHGDAPAPRGAARGARRPREAGRLGGAAGQAPLRLHASVAAHARGARRGRAARERARLREPARCGSSRRRWPRRSKLGAMMLFGEKYGDVVRVVDIDGWSVELCGGTHVRSTAEIGPFAILSESSVGAGSRRIEAVTAGEAFALLHERAREADVLRGELERARKESKRPRQAAETEIVSQAKEGGVLLVEVKSLKGGPLRDFSDRIRQQEKADGAIVASSDDGRAFLVVNFDESLVARGLDAVQVVRELGKHIGGGGGGKPTLAEAGGKNPDGIADALAAAKELVSA